MPEQNSWRNVSAATLDRANCHSDLSNFMHSSTPQGIEDAVAKGLRAIQKNDPEWMSFVENMHEINLAAKAVTAQNTIRLNSSENDETPSIESVEGRGLKNRRND